MGRSIGNTQQIASDVWNASARSLTSVVKTAQYFTITYLSGGLTRTAAITPVDTTKAFVIYLGQTLTEGGAITASAATHSTLVLTNATTVTADRTKGTDDGGTNVTGTVKGVVLEFV